MSNERQLRTSMNRGKEVRTACLREGALAAFRNGFIEKKILQMTSNILPWAVGARGLPRIATSAGHLHRRDWYERMLRHDLHPSVKAMHSFALILIIAYRCYIPYQSGKTSGRRQSEAPQHGFEDDIEEAPPQQLGANANGKGEYRRQP